MIQRNDVLRDNSVINLESITIFTKNNYSISLTGKDIASYRTFKDGSIDILMMDGSYYKYINCEVCIKYKDQTKLPDIK